MKKIYIMSALAVCLFSATACSDFLDREPDKIMTDDQIFGDAVMIKSVLANYYGRVTWGQHINDSYSMTYIDDAAKMDGGPDQRSTFEDDLWRVYDYTFIRNVNQFLKGLRETEVLKDSEKAPLEGEARFLRGRAMSTLPSPMRYSSTSTTPPSRRTQHWHRKRAATRSLRAATGRQARILKSGVIPPKSGRRLRKRWRCRECATPIFWRSHRPPAHLSSPARRRA